ncbi:MAG TPA: FHA domain-containing protein [Pirellulales bacterium]
MKVLGQLAPLGGGDDIPLLKPDLLIGRRESCDVVLRFPNVSSHHCRLVVRSGYWVVVDLKSRNGVKVNDCPIVEQYLLPGDVLQISTHHYEVRYDPADLGAIGPPVDGVSDIFAKPLLERAGLNKSGQEARKREFDERLRRTEDDAS